MSRWRREKTRYEAEPDRYDSDVSLLTLMQLTLTALNISKSAYVCFSFSANRFFSHYTFGGTPQYRDRFFCQLYIRVSLLQVPDWP